jgi:hypothetical protein
MKVKGVEETDGRRAATIEMRTRSNGFVSAFFRVDDLITSTVDASTGHTQSFRFEKNEGGKREVEEFTVDAGGGVIRTRMRRHSGEEVRQEQQRDAPVYDALGVFYGLRLLELDTGDSAELTVFQRNKLYDLRLSADGLEKVGVRGVGEFWAHRMTPSAAMPGLFSKKGSATFWIEETTHVLLRMVVDVPAGSVGMYLARVKGSPLLTAPGARRRRR